MEQACPMWPMLLSATLRNYLLLKGTASGESYISQLDSHGNGREATSSCIVARLMTCKLLGTHVEHYASCANGNLFWNRDLGNNDRKALKLRTTALSDLSQSRYTPQRIVVEKQDNCRECM